MISSMILSDDILDGQLDNEMSLKLKQILYGVWENGILLDSTNSKCLNGIKDKLGNISTKYNKEVSTLIEEMRKNFKQYFFNCPEQVCPDKKCDLKTFPKCLALQCKADALIIPLISTLPNVEVLTLDSYSASETESQRKMYLQGNPVFSLLPDLDKSLFWKRILTYTRNLNIYDAHLGTATDNVEVFSDTLRYLVEHWLKYCVYKIGLSLNITTLSKDWDSNQIKQHFFKKFLPKIPQAPITGNVFLKRQTDSCFHGRYLETDSRVFKCDPGFDFYNNKSKSFKVTTIFLGVGLKEIISKIRRLPEPSHAPRFTFTLM